MKRRYLFYMMAALLTAGCAEKSQDLRNGDLVFVGLPAEYEADNSSMDAAISAATGADNQLNITHVAMIERTQDGTMPPYWESSSANWAWTSRRAFRAPIRSACPNPPGSPQSRFQSSASISDASSAGVTTGSKRATTCPFRSIRNLVKFHLMSGLEA